MSGNDSYPWGVARLLDPLHASHCIYVNSHSRATTFKDLKLWRHRSSASWIPVMIDRNRRTLAVPRVVLNIICNSEVWKVIHCFFIHIGSCIGLERCMLLLWLP